MSTRRVIVDVDVGTDDFMALLVLLHADKKKEIKIEAITCTTGNTVVDNVVKNTVRLLELVQRTDIPVYKGCYEPLLKHQIQMDYFHGIDGLGDLVYETEPDLSIVKNQHAVDALIDRFTSNPKEISLICLGPLTTIALAIKLNRNFAQSLKDLWIMGGNYSDKEIALDDIPRAEFNFLFDPEAAEIVLDCVECPTHILPWETCLKGQISFDWRYNTLGSKTPALKLLSDVEKKVYAAASEEYWLPCDAYLIFAFLNPEKHIIKSVAINARVLLMSHRMELRGLLLVSSSNTDNKTINKEQSKNAITVVERVDIDLFKQCLLDFSETKIM